MGYIGNIVTKSKLEVSSFFNVTPDFHSIDTSIPTLIVGWSEVKQLFPNQDILNSKISDNIYWTFSKREKRYKYEQDITDFTTKVVNELNNKVKYCFFNYVLSPEDKRVRFINYVKSGNCSIYYNTRFLYVFNSVDLKIIGVSLADLSYIGIDIEEFISSLVVNGNIICDNLKCVDHASYNLIKDNTKIIAYLNYLRNYDIYKEKVNNG
jgi:hypothetical protein